MRLIHEEYFRSKPKHLIKSWYFKQNVLKCQIILWTTFSLEKTSFFCGPETWMHLVGLHTVSHQLSRCPGESDNDLVKPEWPGEGCIESPGNCVGLRNQCGGQGGVNVGIFIYTRSWLYALWRSVFQRRIYKQWKNVHRIAGIQTGHKGLYSLSLFLKKTKKMITLYLLS